MNVELHLGDCIDVMEGMEAESVDTVITDPPYGLQFMGKDWDHGIPGVRYWREVLRVAKPGAMLLAFGGTRTHHRLMVAIEDAGWEIRDCLMWLYGSGFPKSYNIGQSLEKKATIGKCRRPDRDLGGLTRNRYSGSEESTLFSDTGGQVEYTDETAKLWKGYGTALKPAWEPIILAMKPLDGTFANNALTHGVAGLWVDGGRIAHNEECRPMKKQKDGNLVYAQSGRYEDTLELKPSGRWPANLILDEEAGAMLDEMSGNKASRYFYTTAVDQNCFSCYNVEKQGGQPKCQTQNGKHGAISENQTGDGIENGGSLEAERSTANLSTDGCGSNCTGQYRQDLRFTTGTGTTQTTKSQTCNSLMKNGMTITTRDCGKNTKSLMESSTECANDAMSTNPSIASITEVLEPKQDTARTARGNTSSHQTSPANTLAAVG